MKRTTYLIAAALSFASLSYADASSFPVLDIGEVTVHDVRLKDPIDISQDNELTIASFNIRNLGTRQRGLKDFQELARLVDEADVVLFQEVGLGLFRGSGEEVSQPSASRIQAFTKMFEVLLGEGWTVKAAHFPTGKGNGRETNVLAHRIQGRGFTISSEWTGYHNLSEDKRDMSTWKLVLTQGDKTRDLHLGSVHLTPDDPDRGEQMIKVTEWLASMEDNWAIAMGDYNYGYKKKSGVPNYLGEDKVEELHDQGELFHLFKSISYKGPGKDDAFRTNLGFRKGAYFYDQFFMTPPLAVQMSEGAKLLRDCGMVAIGVDSYMAHSISKNADRRAYGLEKYAKKADLNTDNDSNYLSAKRSIELTSENDGTWILSDHRIIWMQINVW